MVGASFLLRSESAGIVRLAGTVTPGSKGHCRARAVAGDGRDPAPLTGGTSRDAGLEPESNSRIHRPSRRLNPESGASVRPLGEPQE
jgi:hypothetical protein